MSQSDPAFNKLLITPVAGPSLSFTCNANPRLTDGIARFQGFFRDDRITFFFDRFTRARFPELEPIVGLNVRQAKNRAGKVQLTSDKPCKFVKCRWDDANNATLRGFALVQPNIQEMQGVLEMTTATLEGLEENLALTLFRGDWLLKPDGTVERFI